MRVAVIKGGAGSERDISLVTGKAVEDALARLNIDHVSVELTANTLDPRRLQGADLVFIALHGTYGEDGGVQADLEKLGIPYVGSGVEASRIAMDKLLSKRYFKQAGLSLARYEKITDCLDDKQLKTVAAKIGYPVVTKPNSEGSSIGVNIVDAEAELVTACREALKYSGVGIIEQMIVGRSVEVGIIDEQPLPIIEVRPKRRFYDYTAKYFDASTEYISDPDIPVDVYQTIQRDCLKAHQALGCRHYSRVDAILSEDRRVHILEVNTLPGMTPASILPKAAAKTGLNFDQLVSRLLQLGRASTAHSS